MYAYYRTTAYPSTDDASIDADVVHVASPVGGRIVQLAVHENQRVAKGDLLYVIDPVPYRLTVAQAQADLELARASLDTRRRSLIGERSNAAVAAEQVKRATQNNDLATRDVNRLAPLAAQGPSARSSSTRRSASATRPCRSRRHRNSSARPRRRSATTPTRSRAAREAALARAQHALEDTVRAPHDGLVTGLSVLAGETLAPNQSIFTLIDASEWFAVGNFRETSLSRIEVGDCATVYSMIDRSRPLTGKVVGVGAGIADSARINLPRTLPIVQNSVNWVHVAQRFPVRVKLDEPDGKLVRVGASAIVEVRHGTACR